jgi:hypothetical protein
MAKTSPKQQKVLANAFYTDRRDAIAERCQMVPDPSPGTMVCHIALVDASSTDPFLNLPQRQIGLAWRGLRPRQSLRRISKARDFYAATA